MKSLLFAILLVGCTSTSHRAQVAKVANVAIRDTAYEAGTSESDPATRRLAEEYLNASAAAQWEGIPPSQALSSVGIGQSIEGALSPNISRRDRIRLLYEAQEYITTK